MGWYGLIGSRVGGSGVLFLTQLYPTLDSKGSHWKVTHLILSRVCDVEIVADRQFVGDDECKMGLKGLGRCVN
jgi:hypothetical protein